MEVTIRTRNAEVPDALRAAAEEKLGRLTRYLEGLDHADVLFAREKNPRIAAPEVCEVTIAGHGHLVRAKVAAADQQAAVDLVVAKLEHQLAKLKGRLLGRSHPRRQGPVQSSRTDQPTDGGPERGPEEDGQGPHEPNIVKVKRFPLKPMTPEEAVLQMELLGHDFYFFRNAETEQAAVVYRRNDGDVGLIESS